MASQYVDDRSRVLFVSDGISGGRTWSVYYRKPTGALKRHTGFNSFLSREIAQRELDLTATDRGWREALPCERDGRADTNDENTAAPGGAEEEEREEVTSSHGVQI